MENIIVHNNCPSVLHKVKSASKLVPFMTCPNQDKVERWIWYSSILLPTTKECSHLFRQNLEEVLGLKKCVCREIGAVDCIADLVGAKDGSEGVRPELTSNLWICWPYKLPEGLGRVWFLAPDLKGKAGARGQLCHHVLEKIQGRKDCHLYQYIHEFAWYYMNSTIYFISKRNNWSDEHKKKNCSIVIGVEYKM